MDRIDRYLSKVDRRDPSDCWLWMGKVGAEHGYGCFWNGEKEVKAHRWGYEALVGPIGPGLVVRHTCDVRSCQNPSHWLLGTQADNVRDMIERGRRVVSRQAGEANGNSRLSEGDVADIRERYARGGETYYSLADEFLVTPAMIGHIIKRRRWT